MAETLSFTTAEAALAAKLISDSSLFTTDNMKATDYDSVYLYALRDDDVNIFGWTTYSGGQNQGRGIWAHRVDVTIGIFFRGGADEMNADIRSVSDAMLQTLLPNTNLGGAVEAAYLTSTSRPISVLNQENNIPHVEIEFTVLVEEMMPIGSTR